MCVCFFVVIFFKDQMLRCVCRADVMNSLATDTGFTDPTSTDQPSQMIALVGGMVLVQKLPQINEGEEKLLFSIKSEITPTSNKSQ